MGKRRKRRTWSDDDAISGFIEVAVATPDLPRALEMAVLDCAGVLSATCMDILLSDGPRILIEGPTSQFPVVGLVQGLAV